MKYFIEHAYTILVGKANTMVGKASSLLLVNYIDRLECTSKIGYELLVSRNVFELA